MKFSEEAGTGRLQLRAYGDGWIQVNDKRLNKGFVLTPDTLLEDWEPREFSELSGQHLKSILDSKFELILIGTGTKHLLPTAEIHKTLIENGIGFEIMTTPAACRTYQILNTESRSVLAILFPH